MAQKKFIRFAGVALAAALIISSQFQGTARADRIERGVVVSIEAGEAYFDIAASRGLVSGRPVRIKRPVSLPHPTTGKMVRDELLVGSGVVTLVGERLSMVQMAREVAAVVRVGDVVEALVETLEPTEPAPTPAPRAELPPIPKVAAETAVALRTWNTHVGSALDVKLAAWQRYLSTYPSSPHAARVQAHIDALRELNDRSPTRIVGEQRSITGLTHNARSNVRVGEPVAIAVATRAPEALVGVWLHHRRAGEDTFRRTKLAGDGDGYFRGSLQGDDVAAPGLEYFVEVATSDGEAALAIGSPRQPVRVDVDEDLDIAAFRERRNRSRVSISVDSLDYSTFDKRRDGEMHRDRFFVYNADFLFRLRNEATRLWGIRVGLGAINGKGGFADEPMGESAGFNYGYTEFEFRILGESAVSARGVAGIGKEGLGFGVEGRIRLGSEVGSNLSFGVSSLEEIGFLSEVRMQWAAAAVMPLGFSIGVTDRPNQGDLGVRLGTDIGWRALPWFQPTLRVSYLGRSLKHSGLGVGLGMVFDW